MKPDLNIANVMIKMKAIPNCLSFSRIIFSLILLFVTPLGLTFYTLYLFCGISDVMDGFIARKSGTTSSFGAKLDSLADLIMIVVLFIRLYPILSVKTIIVIWVVSIGVIRLASMFIAYKKYKAFALLHTYGNKITGLTLFIFPILLLYIDTTILIYIICVFASISAIEEFIIQLTSNQLQLNKHSLFMK